MLFAAACTLGNGSTPTANNTPVPPSPSLLPVQASPSPSPSSQPTASAPAANGLAVASIPTHNGEVGVIYLAVTLQASGGTGPYTWSGTAMPPGLSVSPQGVVTGNNTTAGKYSFTVQVTDSTGATATGTQNMTVFPPLTVGQPCVNLCLVGLGCTTCGRFGTVAGGAGPYHYKVVGGFIPPGMSLNGFSLGGPWPFASPSAPNLAAVDIINVAPRWALAVSVTDDFNVTKTVSANWIEFGPIGMNCQMGIQCTSIGTNGGVDTSITYSGGNPTDSVTVLVTHACHTPVGAAAPLCSPSPSQVAAYLPPIWSATAKNGTVTITAGCDSSCQTWFGDITIVLVDHGTCVAPLYVNSPSTDVNIDF